MTDSLSSDHIPGSLSSQAGSVTKLGRREFLAASTAATGMTLLSPRAHAAEERPRRVAVIGHTGQGNYGHGVDTMWLELPETELIAFADADEAGRERERKKLKTVPAFADYREMLKQVQPEIVAVAPRFVDEHRDMILAAIAAGAKGIYVEKPFCRTPAEADEIVKACEASGCRLAIAHRNRYHPVLPVLKNLLEEGLIGELLELRGRGKEDQRGGGLDLWVLGSHVIDLARYFAGEALACSSVVQQGKRLATPQDVYPGAEGVGLIVGDQLHARFDMANGLPFYFDSIRDAGNRPLNFGLQLIGNEGIIDLRIDVEPLAHVLKGNPFLPVKEPRVWTPISTAGVGKPEPLAKLSQQVSHHLLGGRDLVQAIDQNRPPRCSATDGRTIVEMIQAVFTSHAHAGRRVTLPLASRENPLVAWTAGVSR